MAELQISMYAPSIIRSTTFWLCLPNDIPPFLELDPRYYERPTKTLVLLHGFSGNATDWLMNSRVSELSKRYNLAIAMPQGDNSFYLNGTSSCDRYEDFLCCDLVEYLQRTFGLAAGPEDTLIGGLSMGGFGALHSCLAHPEVYGKGFGLSSGLITDLAAEMRSGAGSAVLNAAYYRSTFGDPDRYADSSSNPKYLVRALLAAGKPVPPLYLACGTEDVTIQLTRDFHDFLTAQGVAHAYAEGPGIHDWDFWNRFLEPAIRWALGETES